MNGSIRALAVITYSIEPRYDYITHEEQHVLPVAA